MKNIYDIAKDSGVSIATVSRVLNGSSRVTAETRDRVLAVMQKENYMPNAFARGLGLDTMRMVGILCTDVSDAYYARAVSLVESDLRRRGFNTLLCSTGNDLSEKKKCLSLLLSKRVDAVVLIGSAFSESSDNSHLEAAAAQVPVIIINGLVEIPGVTCVLCDERSAMAENVALLGPRAEKGILYLYDVLTYSGCEKRAGYRLGLKRAGLPLRRELEVHTEKSVDAAEAAAETLLSKHVPFSAVMTSEDLLAAGALRALRKEGVSLPVIGFNNSILAECTYPALSSVDNRLEKLCPTAVSLLSNLLSGKRVPEKTVIPARFVERESFRAEP